jgi:hypothetical protein
MRFINCKYLYINDIMLFQNICTNIQQPCQCNNIQYNSQKLLIEFLNNYYGEITNSGWYGTLRFYDDSCQCMLNDELMKPYDLICNISKNGIQRGIFSNPLATLKLFSDNKKIIVNVSSKVNLIGFNNNVVCEKMLFENFIISLENYKIIDHTMHIR